MTQTPTPTTSTFHPRPGDRHEPARDAGSRPDQPAQSAPGAQRHPSQRPADRAGDPRQSTPQREVTQVPADRDVTTSTTSTTQLNASERAAGDAHVTRGSAFPGLV